MLRNVGQKIACFLIPALLVFGMPASAAIVPGEKAPNFTLYDVSGNTFKLSDHAGKIIVLEWNNPECPFVHKYYDSGAMQALQKKYTAQDVVWVMINSAASGKQGFQESTQALATAVERGAAPSFILPDPTGKVGHLYQAKTTPHMYVINKGMRLAYIGAIDSTPSTDKADIPKSQNYVVRALEELMEGKDVTIPTTRAYGCSVKYAD
jgi:hypothetical protein